MLIFNLLRVLNRVNNKRALFEVSSPLANLIRTFDLEKKYIDEDSLWEVILSAEDFSIHSTLHTINKNHLAN